MKKIILTLIITIAAVPALLKAEDIQDMTREAIRANKKLIVKTNMQPVFERLTDEEEKKFWEIYDHYQEDLQKIMDSRIRLIEYYAQNYRNNTMSDLVAKALLDSHFEINEDLLEVKEDLQDTLARKSALGAQEIMRYMQIENKLEAIINFHLAREIPLAPVPEAELIAIPEVEISN